MLEKKVEVDIVTEIAADLALETKIKGNGPRLWRNRDPLAKERSWSFPLALFPCCAELPEVAIVPTGIAKVPGPVIAFHVKS